MSMSLNKAKRWVGPLPPLLGLILLSGFGCSDGVETPYGRSRTRSINGTGVLAAMFRARGHEVRAAVRLSEGLRDWADVVVRVAPFRGPVPREEADWYDSWMDLQPSRRVIYVPRDHDADVEYWTRALEQLPADSSPRLRERAQAALDKARPAEGTYPSPLASKEFAEPKDWFALEPPVPSPGTEPGASPGPKRGTASAPVVVNTMSVPPSRACGLLGGPWARGVNAPRAAIPFRHWLKTDDEEVLLSCGSKTLAMSWTRFNDSRVLVLANGSFLLNAGLAANPARRPLADRVVDWAGFSGDENEGEAGVLVPKHVAFVEGFHVATEPVKQPSVFDLLSVEPFGKVAAQLLALGLVACLARAPRLGRARPDDPSGADRPAAHPEALGALLARTGQAAVARFLLESYRHWRQAPSGRTRTRTTSHESQLRR